MTVIAVKKFKSMVCFRSTDNLILAGHVEGDSSMLEVYVYNDVEDALYVHHDILLQSFPLALEWLCYDPESDKRGNMVAVGTMEPIVEVSDQLKCNSDLLCVFKN